MIILVVFSVLNLNQKHTYMLIHLGKDESINL